MPVLLPPDVDSDVVRRDHGAAERERAGGDTQPSVLFHLRIPPVLRIPPLIEYRSLIRGGYSYLHILAIFDEKQRVLP